MVTRVAGLWLAWVVLDLPFEMLRNFGDSTFRPRNFERLEQHAFGFIPTRFLQAHLHGQGYGWLDTIGYLLHGFWFGLPFSFALIVTIYGRRHLMEFWGWLLIASYLSLVFFLLLPVRPPWMQPGVIRILTEGDGVDYASLDNNPVAAFPSLHAALPMTIALFMFARFPTKRFYGFLALGFAISIGAAVVYLGEHWVIDVLGGYAVAGFTAFLFLHRRPRAAAHRIPGRPIQHLGRLNDWLFPPESSPVDEDQAPALPIAA